MRHLTALCALLLVGVLLAHVPGLGHEAEYVGVLAALLGTAGGLAAVRMWLGCRCLAPSVLLGVVALLLTGQLLNLAVGLPGAPGLRGGLGPTTTTLLVLDVAVAGLVLVGLRRGIGPAEAP